VREFGKEKFEAEVKAAMPLSQYILQHLSESNPLQSQEDRVRFLNEAEPILQQINAPRSAMYLRKEVSELAKLSAEEMQSLLKLPNVNRPPAQARPKLTRTTVSLQKRFCLILLRRPSFAIPADLALIDGRAEEDVLLKQTIETCLQYPHSNSAVLLHELETKVDPKVLNELGSELMMLDETLDFEKELAGIRMQLQDVYSHKESTNFLARIGEKPLSALTEEEKALLKSVGNKPSQNRA
jgi:DNA primase